MELFATDVTGNSVVSFWTLLSLLGPVGGFLYVGSRSIRSGRSVYGLLTIGSSTVGNIAQYQSATDTDLHLTGRTRNRKVARTMASGRDNDEEEKGET